ncbi:MAG: chromosomal replication initiator protein DnaA, partial [Nitrospinae bacterium]|nr:chromosomal replication initiator protein DnaA [Nitrospinota bacterium]
MAPEAVWDVALAYIEAKVPKQVFDTWFTPTRLQGIAEATAHIEVPNKFFGQWLSQHYGGLISEALAAGEKGETLSVAFVTGERGSTKTTGEARPLPVRAQQTGRQRRFLNLNPKYTFTSFVVGASNQFAH